MRHITDGESIRLSRIVYFSFAARRRHHFFLFSRRWSRLLLSELHEAGGGAGARNPSGRRENEVIACVVTE